MNSAGCRATSAAAGLPTSLSTAGRQRERSRLGRYDRRPSAADGGSVVSTTDPAPLSDAGDAHFMKPIMVPDVCFAPIVLIQIAGINGNLLDQPANWIAVTGSSD